MGQPGAVGVDFGTATTLVAERVTAGPASVVPVGRTTRWLPSVVRVDGLAVIVGEDADDGGPGQVRSVKRASTGSRKERPSPTRAGSKVEFQKLELLALRS